MGAKVVLCIAAALTVTWGCDSRSPELPDEGNGGSGGTSHGGNGGVGGTGGMSNGGSGGGEGGTGGGSGEGALPGIWTPVEFEVAPKGFKLYEADPATLDLPKPVWESCGPGCDSTKLSFGEVTGAVKVSLFAPTNEEAIAVVGAQHLVEFKGGSAVVYRVIRLTDGKSISAFVGRPEGDAGKLPVMSSRLESATSLLLSDGNSPSSPGYASMLQSFRRLFREPWDESHYRGLHCEHFDLEGSPPAYMFACPRGLEVMLETGDAMVLPDSQYSVWGAGNRGLAVWAQHNLASEPGRAHRSRIRGWSPGEEVRELAEVDGLVCGLGVGEKVVFGIVGDDILGGSRCNSGLTNARFFILPRSGGTLVRGPVPPVESRSFHVGATSITGDYVGLLLAGEPDMPYTERWKIVLLRLSDWQMRVFPVPQGRSISTTGVAVDLEHLYFATKMNEPFKPQGFDRLYRYRLDHFDQIGEPAEAAAP